MFVNWQRELAVALCESWTIMLSENSTSTLWFLWERISRNKCITWCASIINFMVVYWCQYIPPNSKIKLGCRRRRCSCAFVLSSNYEWSCQKVSSFYINIPSSDSLLKRFTTKNAKTIFSWGRLTLKLDALWKCTTWSHASRSFKLLFCLKLNELCFPKSSVSFGHGTWHAIP